MEFIKNHINVKQLSIMVLIVFTISGKLQKSSNGISEKHIHI